MSPNKFWVWRHLGSQNNFGVKIILGQNKFCSEKILGLKICLGLYRYFLSQKNVCPKKIFGPKIFRPKIFLGQNNFWSKTNFWFENFFCLKTILGLKKIYGPKNILGLKKIFSQKNFLGSNKIFGPKQFFGPKKCSVWKKFGSETNSDFKKMFFGRKILCLKDVFKKILCQKKCCIQNLLCPKCFFLWPKICWVKTLIWINVGRA